MMVLTNTRYFFKGLGCFLSRAPAILLMAAVGLFKVVWYNLLLVIFSLTLVLFPCFYATSYGQKITKAFNENFILPFVFAFLAMFQCFVLIYFLAFTKAVVNDNYSHLDIFPDWINILAALSMLHWLMVPVFKGIQYFIRLGKACS